jgi:putative peptidoglycan lipid II flippase
VSHARPAAGTGMLRANAVVAVGTLLSRLTGFARYALLVALVRPALADAYNVANNVPTMLYELVLGGVLTATLIPMFTEQADAGDAEATSAIVSTALVAMAGLAIATFAASPLLVRLLTLASPGDAKELAQLRSVATYFAFWFAPQIVFYGLTFLASGLLNARRRFFAAAWAPVLNNVVVIVALVAMARAVKGDRTLAIGAGSTSLRLWLALPTTAGIVAMALSFLPALRRAGVRLRIRPQRRHPAVRRVLALSRWTAGYVVANQIALFVITALTKPGSGGYTAYYLAFLVLQLPIGLLAMPVATTFGPELARARHARDRAAFVATFGTGARALSVVLLPAAAGLAALARPVVALVLEHGSYRGTSATQTASALTAFAVGMPFLAGYLYALRGFYAHDDTRSPFAINLIENGLNIALGAALVGRFGVPGLAWSFTVAYVVAAVLAVRVLAWKVRGLQLRPLVVAFVRVGVPAAVAGEVAWLAGRAVGADTGGGAALRVAVGTVAGSAAYIVGLAFVRAPELAELRRLGRRVVPSGSR